MLPMTLMAIPPAGSSAITIGPDTPPAWMMCVIFSRAITSRRRARSERSSITCVVGDGRGSRPSAFRPAAARRDMITRPTNPLDPVTSVTNSLMRLNHTARTQTRDALRIVAKAGEDLIGVLAELRRRPVRGRLRRLREVDRLADHLDVSQRGMAHGL